MDRRDFVKAAAAAAIAPPLASCTQGGATSPPVRRWADAAYTRPETSSVAVLPAATYDPAVLIDAIGRAVRMAGLDARGKRVVLKPNLVEFDPAGAINTHPAVIGAAVEVFRTMGAGEVIVAEGPGHRRDNEYLLSASGLLDILRDTGARYVDLNTDVVRAVRLRSSYTRFGVIYLPRTVTDADLFVSMPKLKTHHWAGATLSMKNLFGIMPGSVYGWPKNALHWQGIEQSIIDINAALPTQRFNIVDGVIGMEGDGPILGTPRQAGVMVCGADPVAVDATCARLMMLEPERMAYVAEAGTFIGNIERERITQLAEDVEGLAQDFAVVEGFQRLKPSAYRGVL